MPSPSEAEPTILSHFPCPTRRPLLYRLLTNVTSLAAGGNQSLALLRNCQTNGPVPASLTNATAIAAGSNFSLALRSNGTVVAWGANDQGQTNVPAGLTNVVAIAAGGFHALALRANGTVVGWGSLSNAPADFTNVMTTDSTRRCHWIR